MTRSDKPTAPTQRRDGSSKGTGRGKPANELRDPQKLSVKSVLIEPRENEPPRVSVAVEYTNEAPDVKAMKKAALTTVHDVVRAADEGLVDLGERQDVQRGKRTQCFSAERGGE